MGFARFADVDDAKIGFSQWRKTTAATSAANIWYDDSMLSGVPVTNFYASEPLTAATIPQSKGLRHWVNDSSFTEHLLDVTVWGTAGTLEAPSQFLLCDYLLYYPFIDGDSTDLQEFTNEVTLPRYSDGEGVRMMLVAQGTNGAYGSMTITYTNQDGTPGRTVVTGTAFANAVGQLLTGQSGITGASPYFSPFVGLQGADTGVRSVESVQWTTAPGGSCALVLVKPLAPFLYAEIGTVAETSFYPRFPKIEPGAYLNLLRCAGAATPSARVFEGVLRTIRS